MFMLEHETQTLNLKSGRLCLDFANTADWHASDQPEERLNSYTDLVSWAERVGLLAEEEVQQLLREAARHPDDAAVVLEQAISFREGLFRIFSAVAAGDSPEAADLATLNEVLSTGLGRLHIVSTSAGFG
jgi:predicted RNA-binding Zn ribbon-like protein